jgi:FlaA1/EpsC-like NDP-sugar epimerase
MNKKLNLLLFLRERALEVFSKFSVPRWMVFTLDSLAVFLVFFIAYILRYNFNLHAISFPLAFNHAFVATGVYMIFSLVFRSYSGLIRHTTLTDIAYVFLVTTLSAVSLIALTFISRILNWGENFNIPVSIIVIHYVSISIFLFFVRIFIKLIFRFATSSFREAKRVVIYGAGETGFVVKRVIMSNPDQGFNVVGFVDDDKSLQGKKMNGIPVYGYSTLTKEFIAKNRIDSLVLAFRTGSSEKKRVIIKSAIDLGLEVMDTPAVDKWMNGQLEPRQIRKVKLEDLLGRDTIKLDMDKIGKGLNNKTILVTGAAGSIGSEIVRQLARFRTKQVILVDQAETPIYQIEHEIINKFNELKYHIILADVTNYRKMELIFREYKPEIVFHAAAYKHVPLMEENPHEALRVNVGGTKVVTDLAVKYGVAKFVMISTDKSVNPSSVMGASKRVCEMLVQSVAEQSEMKTKFVITRFGNVLGSNGSVIPLFTKQIEEGGPVTVTHPDITRYFMTIPEACELVLEAGFMGKGNEIYVFDMGDPVKITDLATQMIKLSGYEPEKDIKIVYTGLRPGEKLYEELLTNNENTLPTHHPKIRLAQVQKYDYPILLSKIELLIKNAYLLSKEEVVNLFREIVPEFHSLNGKYNGEGKKKEVRSA